MSNDEEFSVDLNPIPSVIVKSGKEIQKFNGSWYRGNSTNFIPSKKLLNQPNSIKEYILKGYLPSKPFIEKDTVITGLITEGTEFASIKVPETLEGVEPSGKVNDLFQTRTIRASEINVGDSVTLIAVTNVKGKMEFEIYKAEVRR